MSTYWNAKANRARKSLARAAARRENVRPAKRRITTDEVRIRESSIANYHRVLRQHQTA